MLKYIKPLPIELIKRHHKWRTTQFVNQQDHYRRLAHKGQQPCTMVISCCDSRLHVTEIFAAQAGDFFIHRNIANLVPPYALSENYHSTAAAVEYAVCVLRVSSIIVMGHSLCGGVKEYYNMRSNRMPCADPSSNSFIGSWMNILRPGYERIAAAGITGEQTTRQAIRALEYEGILVSLENLMNFPFVRDQVDKQDLDIYGVWFDIKDGRVEYYNAERNVFEAI